MKIDMNKIIESCIVDGKLNFRSLVFKIAWRLNVNLKCAWFMWKTYKSNSNENKEIDFMVKCFRFGYKKYFEKVKFENEKVKVKKVKFENEKVERPKHIPPIVWSRLSSKMKKIE